MAETIGEANKTNLFAGGDVNTNLPLEDMLAQMKETSKAVAQPANEISTDHEVKTLSPLEKLKQAKEDATLGAVVTNEALNAGRDKAPERNAVYTDERMEEFEKSIQEKDETITKRNAVMIIKQPQTQGEYIQMMEEIDSIKFDENGKAYFSLTNAEGIPYKIEYCRIREDNEAMFDFSAIRQYDENGNEITGAVAPQNAQPVTEGAADESVATNEEVSEISPETKETVQVIIDKTGLGTDFLFTEEEKEKIKSADVILLNETKLIDINAIRAKKSAKSFQDVIKEFDISGSRTTMCFPASGFKAQMKGLTYGEYADVTLSMENVTFDQYYKRLSIIYNKMTNISSGPFEDFEDFLHKFSYTDIPLAIYGMFISTEEEELQMGLHCGNAKCKKSFDWKYSTRSLLRLDRCSSLFLKNMRELASAPASSYDELQKNSSVMNTKYIELPNSKFVVELGVASCYEFLYNFVPLMEEDKFKEAFGDDLNEIYLNNMMLLTAVRSIRVPDEDGTYIECYGYKDILDAIYNISPEEIKILAAYTAKITTEYEMVFSFGKVVCPHCKEVTEALDVTMDDLVFQTYQRLMNTNVDLNNIQDI